MVMKTYKVYVVGGHCSNRYMIVAEQLTELFEKRGLPCQVITHGVAGEYSFPPRAHLILQLLPAFTEAEAGCPVINIKPLIGDPNHPATIQKVIDCIHELMAQEGAPAHSFTDRVLVSAGSCH
jgi:hypothetical protein